MADEQQTQPVVEATEQAQAATSAETIKPDTQPQDLMIPKSRFDEVNSKLRALEAEAAKQAKAAQEADERRKVEQGEYQKLAEERKARLDELTPKTELADRLSDIVTKQLDAEIEAWPESVRAIMPNAESSLLERLEWAERTRPLAQELLAAKGQQPAGTRYPAQHPGNTGGSKPVDLAQAFLQKQNEQAAARPNPLLKK